MKVLIAGGSGQVGWELTRTAPEEWQVVSLGSTELDIRHSRAVERAVKDHAPQLIINAAAYTAVDEAESDREAAFAVNADGAANLATAALDVHARLLHLSTDFVFDGLQSHPYQPQDVPNPAGVYGASKLAGERLIPSILIDNYVIIRTAWLYSAHGKNFVKTMLHLMDERDEIGVVADQVGSPTWARGLAEAIWMIARRPDMKGICHWTDAGVASWYDFAIAIQEEAHHMGLLNKTIPVKPVTTEDYPTAAKRPPFSVLDKTGTWRQLGCIAPHWRVHLRRMLLELRGKKDE